MKFIGEDFGSNFVDHAAKSNRPEVDWGLPQLLFWGKIAKSNRPHALYNCLFLLHSGDAALSHRLTGVDGGSEAEVFRYKS